MYIDMQYINLQGSNVWTLIAKIFHFLRSSDPEICKNHDIIFCYPHDLPRQWSVIKLLPVNAINTGIIMSAKCSSQDILFKNY